MIWLGWLAARAVGLVTAARGGSLVAALGIGTVGIAAAIAAGWVWLALHDRNVARTAETACVARSVADGLAAQNKALLEAIAIKDRRATELAVALEKNEHEFNRLEAEQKELRDAEALKGGDAAVVFDADDNWLRQRRSTSGVVKAGRR